MDAIIFDRFAMGFSLGIHIVLAVIGMALPVIILISEYLSIKYKDNDYSVLAKRLTLAFALFFAVGTASGMLVGVNLFFLWPNFMAVVSKVAILPVYAEVFAFFAESIFLGLYFYSGKIFEKRYSHVLIMGVVASGAAASAALITILNAFMNTPVGFNINAFLANGTLTNLNPLAVFNSPSAGIEVAHVLSSSYLVGTALLLAYFAYRFLRTSKESEKRYYSKASKLAFCILLVATIVTIYTGIRSIEGLYYFQPEKYAAIELNLNTTNYAPELIGGMDINNSVKYAMSIPNLQSILATGYANGTVPGLNQYPQSTWPPLFIHDLFDLMVIAGFGIGIFLIIVLYLHFIKKKVFKSRAVMWLFIAVGALSLLLLENGWMVDEIGRQPWIIYDVMTVQQAANTSTAIIPLAILIVAVYIVIIPFTLLVLKRIFSKRVLSKELMQ